MLGVSKHIDECAAGLTPQFTIFPFYKILSPSEVMRKNKERFFISKYKPGPGRPVISGCGTPTEKISAFVDQKVLLLVPEIKSYIKDTNDFLHKLGELGDLPEGAIL